MLDIPESKKPHQTDVIVGRNIRTARQLRGMSQEKLGESLGVTFQQIQKYEKGTNRVSASVLLDTAKALGVPVVALYDGATPTNIDEIYKPLPADAIKIARLFNKITSDHARRACIQMLSVLAKAELE